MSRLSFENKINSYDYVTKVGINKLHNLPKLDKAVVSFRLKVISEYDMRVAHSLIFSDWFTGQRGFIKSFNFIYKFNKPMIQIVVVTTLRGRNLNNFFDFLLVNYFSILKHKLVSTKVSLLPSSISFNIHDINFFYNVPNFLYNFRDIFNVQIFYKKLDRKLLFLSLSKYREVLDYVKKVK